MVNSISLQSELIPNYNLGSHITSADVSASPSRVVESVGTFTERHQFWKEKDDEERKKRESVSSIEDYTQGFDNSGFAGADSIDKKGVVEPPVVPHRTPSPYEIERSKEAIFLDTDDPEQEEKEVQLEDLVQYQVRQQQQQQQPHTSQAQQHSASSSIPPPVPERKVLFQGMSSSSERSISMDSEKQLKEQISREIFESELAEKIETLEPESKSLIQEQYEIRDDSDKSETETTEKLQSGFITQERLEDVRHVASTLVSEIESTVERKLEQGGVVEQPKQSEPSSVDITDEELMSTGDVSSPEPQRSYKVCIFNCLSSQ